jgi:hypothetical protein
MRLVSKTHCMVTAKLSILYHASRRTLTISLRFSKMTTKDLTVYLARHDCLVKTRSQGHMKNIRTLFALMRRVGNICNCSMATRTNATAFIYTIIYSSA